MARPQSEGRDDLVRDRILRFLFERRKRRPLGYKTTEIERELKALDIKAGEVRGNLPYLLDNDWVVREDRERTFRAPGGTMQNATETKYRISARGIDLVNNANSPYSQNRGQYAGVHIENVSGMVILGDNNVVSAKAVDIVRPLDNLAAAVEQCDELGENERYSYSADLGVLRAALVRPEPNKTVIKTIVDSLAPLAHIATIASLVTTLVEALHAAGLC